MFSVVETPVQEEPDFFVQVLLPTVDTKVFRHLFEVHEIHHHAAFVVNRALDGDFHGVAMFVPEGVVAYLEYFLVLLVRPLLEMEAVGDGEGFDSGDVTREKTWFSSEFQRTGDQTAKKEFG